MYVRKTILLEYSAPMGGIRTDPSLQGDSSLQQWYLMPAPGTGTCYLLLRSTLL